MKLPFEALKDYWHQQLKDYGPKNIILGLVANNNGTYSLYDKNGKLIDECA